MQILWGLAKEKEAGGTFFAESLSKAVLFTPCYIGEPSPFQGLFEWPGLGVHNIKGPGWD